MKKTIKTPLAAAIGTAVVSTFTTSAVNAEANPFSMTELSEGYMQVAQSDSSANYTVKPFGKKAKESSCGEGKCGGMMDGDKMKKGMESSCGAMMKGKEGACGDMKEDNSKMGGMDMKGGDMSCGAMMNKMKSGEMACGGMMEKMKNGEMSCGAMMEKMKGKMGGMDMKGGSMGGMDMKGGEMSCGSKIDPAKASGE